MFYVYIIVSESSNILYLEILQKPFIVISACKQIIPYLYIQPSSWRTLGFGICRGHRKE